MRFRHLLSAMICVAQVLWFAGYSSAQCTQSATTNLSPQPNRCQTAVNSGNIVPFFNQCGTICMDNTGAGPSNQVHDHRCTGGVQPANDLFLYANNPYAHINNYDGSLVFRWVNWPNRSQGVPPPYFAVHGEVKATLSGITVQSIDCTDGFALENAICVDSPVGNQFYAGPGTIPTLAQLTPLVRQIAGVPVNVEDVSFWINVATHDGATGPICFEVSAYKTGFLCGDPASITLTGSGTTRTGAAPSLCLCSSALYGGLGNVNNNFPLPCGGESSASAWYKIVAPFGCNKITASLGSWGGTAGQYNIAVLSGVSCPGTSGTNPITGAATFLPGQTLASGASIVASECGGPAVTSCNPVPSGEYYIVVSGKTERPTFQLNVSVEDVSPSVGTASSAQNNTNVCSGSPIVVADNGSVLPLHASCGQDIAWYYSTSLSFNPYSGAGTYAGTGVNDTLTLPANTTCQPKTYYIKGIISDNGTTAVAGCKATTNTITVTVYPEIGNVTVNNTQCLISVATRCSNFTVNGHTGVSNFVATFADNGTTKNFIISNGLAGCNQVIQEVVSCSGNCTQPVVTATSVCDTLDPYNFYVDINFAPGSAASYYAVDNFGGVFPFNGAGTYRVGPYSNLSTVSLAVDNPTDSACNLPLGTFTKDCNTIRCPNLISASTNIPQGTTAVCEGSQTVLQASVDQGVVNQDYTVQWYKDGVPIPNGNSLVVAYTFSAAQGCSAEAQTFTVAIKCLRTGGTPSTVSSLTAGTVVVNPKPQLGRDFTQDSVNCNLAPLDRCGGLNIVYSPTTNPTPGASPTTVSYTVSVPGASSGCSTTGSYVVNCPNCSNAAGNGITANSKTYCYGEQFHIGATPATLGPGFTQAWAVTTTNPYGNLNTAVANAIAANQVIGPDSTGNGFNFTSGVSYPPGDYYFIPFTAMKSINAAIPAYADSGSITATPPIPVIIAGTATKVITIPQLPYCNGTTAFSATFNAHQTSGVGSPIDNVQGFMTYSGSATNNTGTITRNNYTLNPSGQTTTLNISSSLGATVAYNFKLFYQNSITYPFVCPTCNDVGTPIHVKLLPQITLSPIANQTTCVGGSFNLINLNPTANLPGNFTWYDGDPNAGGQLVADPTNVSPTNGQQYFVVFKALADTLCSTQTSVTFNTSTPPALTPIPAQSPVCLGDHVNLTQLESGITSTAGTFIWYKGDPDSNGVRLPNAFATNLSPIDGQDYYAVFTDLSTGCSNKESVSYSVLPLPPLSGVPTQNLCAGGGSFDLTSLQPSFTTAPGTFTWYLGDPSNGGTQLTSTQAASVSPQADTVYYAVFNDSVTGCNGKINVVLKVNPLPALTAPNPAQECSGTVVDLTLLEQGITSTAGSFTWYVGDPANGGTQLSQTDAQTFTLNSNTAFYIVFVNAITQCTNTTHFTYSVKPSPVLNTLPQQSICTGTTVNLNSLDSVLTTANGFFTWFNGDPDNGGIQLTTAQASSVTPTAADTFYVQFLAFPSGCVKTVAVNYNVNTPPTLNPIANPGQLCGGTNVNLTSLQAGISSSAGSFAWYAGNPASGGTAITGSSLTALVPSASTTYYVVFTDSATGCTSSESINFNISPAITHVNVSYDCGSNVLVVDLSAASGGSGGGYQVSATSPDTAGEVLANGSAYTVIVEDSVGCTDTIRGFANCLACAAGTASPTDANVCCDSSGLFTVTGAALAPGKVIAWALTPQSAGPVTDFASIQTANAAGNVFLGDTTGSGHGVTIVKNCPSDTLSGDYYLTPFIANSPNIQPVLWDTAAGCVPSIVICPTVSGSNWQLDPLVIIFPNGFHFNVDSALIGGAPITPGLLAALGGLPCLDLAGFYSGDPNGVWGVSINNTGTGAVTFGLPAFQSIVSADSGCTLLAPGTSQVLNIPPISGTVAAGANQTISITIPPLSSGFPTIDSSCFEIGTPAIVHFCVTGIDEIPDMVSISIYPNPTDASFTIQGQVQTPSDVRISVVDMLGAEVTRVTRKMEVGKFTETIDLSSKAQGIYFVTIQTNNQTITHRIAKQ